MSTRLDDAVKQKYPSYPKSLIQKFIKGGMVKVDDIVTTKNGKPVKDNQKVELKITDKELHEDIEIDIEVIYEDENLVAINKPAGVLSHSKGAFNPEPTVSSWLKKRKDFSFKADEDRAGIVHRLDRATSGVMVCAKNSQTHAFLQKQFQNRTTKKTYIARVAGEPKQNRAVIDMPIARNPKKPQTFCVNANGRSAITEFSIIEKINKDTLIELKPKTGRTHQLRVHLNYIGLPIVGDYLYDGRKADRLYLHASEIELTIPNSKRVTFKAEVPESFYNEKV